MLEYGSSIMYYPLRHETNVNKESMLNSSATSLLDGSGSSARPFGSSAFTSQSGAAPGFHHAGNLQGLHNQGSYNMQAMPNALSSRNAGFGGPSGVAHQSTGSVASGRFSTNNLVVGLSQLSQGGLHGHSSMTNRTGTSVGGNHSFNSNVNGVGGSGVGSPGSSSIANRGSLSGMGGSPSQMGNVGRIASSVGGIGAGGVSLGGGGGLTRALNAGGGVNMQNLSSSRVNMGQLSGSSGIGVQGPGRSANSLLQQGVNMSSSTYNSGDLLAMLSRASPQGVSSMLGNNFSTSPSSGLQGQLHSANGHVGGMSPSGVGNGNDGVAFDINDFPQLTTRQSSSANMQGSLRKQGVGINAIVQQNQEFSIPNEDFPALPGYKGGSHDLASELQQHHKDQQHEMAAMQAQHFLMGRSSGFSQGGSYGSNRHMIQQQQQQPTGNASDLHLHAGVGDSFSPARGVSASYHSPTVGPPGSSATQVHRSGGGGALGQYDHSLSYHHQSSSRTGGTFTQQQLVGMAGTLRDSSKPGGSAHQPDRFGLLGLLSVIRMTDPDLTTLALGTDLTTLGLNLNSRENLYKTFASPWADEPVRGEPEFVVPPCYDQKAPQLQANHYAKFQDNTLFYIFYSMPRDEAQLYAADELSNRGWFFHKELKRWLKRAPNSEPLVKNSAYERGTLFFLDPTTLEIGCKENFVLHYDMLEKCPQLPTQQ